MADKALVCRDCGAGFVFTEGEQAFYAAKGFTNEPVRCKNCRRQKKSGSFGQGTGSGNGWNNPRYSRY